VNIFHDYVEGRRADAARDGYTGYYQFGGVYVCYDGVETFVILALASAKDTLSQTLDMERFMAMWAKDCYRGKVALPDEAMFNGNQFGIKYTAVHWKVFKKYVLTNRHRILFTRKEMEKYGERWDEEMWRDMEDDLDRELDEKYGGNHQEESDYRDYADAM
jgi:hypothetical protein